MIKVCLLVLIAVPVFAQEERRRRHDPEKVHDPSTVLAQDGAHRFFSTGHGVSLMREQADGKWLVEARVFERDKLPGWHEERVPGNRGHLWAPDVIKLGEQYFVYYSVSTFGKNTSAIGLATGKTLDPESPDWGWKDKGVVVASVRTDRFNAIDPAVFRDSDDRLYMTFGSFWDGIFIIDLDPKTGLRLYPDKAPKRLAWSEEIEAPFLTKAPDGSYVLFVNWGNAAEAQTPPTRFASAAGSPREGRLWIARVWICEKAEAP